MDMPNNRALRAILLLVLTGCPGADTDKTDDSGTSASCEGSTPVLDSSGAATGYERCADGTLHRVSAVAADPTISVEPCRGTETYLDCTTNADCGGGSNVLCYHIDNVVMGGRSAPPAGDESGCQCATSCATDADCGADKACVPVGLVDKDESWSTCEPASCATDADCASGECGLSSYNDGCYYETHLSCRSEADSCRVDADCPEENNSCGVSYAEEAWSCQSMDCAIGRPLRVAGAARTAEAAPRGDWAGEITECAEGLSPILRAQLAQHWTRVAAMEHASIASFARFSLQLLSLGAPPELLVSSQRAATDEVAHARLAYGLASAYAGEEVGPGPLSLEGMTLAMDREAVLCDLVEEACVGETMGAAEARAAAAGVADPTLRELLSTLAEDETRHAALAWKTLRWMLEQDPGLRVVADAAFARAIGAAQRSVPGPGLHLPSLGVLGPETQLKLRLSALREVIEPCWAALGGRVVSAESAFT